MEMTSPVLRDYYELLKPRVMRLVVFTSLVGMVVAPVDIHPVLAIISLLCIALGAGASGALNMWIDHDIDAVMKRTVDRPIPSGRVPREHALGLGIFASIFSVAMLGLFANWAAGAFLAFTIFFYVVIYSMGLKRRTAQNIVIGGAAGAFPPALGWMAATGDLALEPILLFLVIFLWTPAHFWALALFRNDDYTAAKVPMLPVVSGEPATRFQMLVYAILFVISCLVTSFTSIGGPLTLLTSIVLGAMFVWQSFVLLKRDGQKDGYKAEKRYFALSIVFLFVFFLAVLVDYFIMQNFAIPFPVIL